MFDELTVDFASTTMMAAKLFTSRARSLSLLSQVTYSISLALSNTAAVNPPIINITRNGLIPKHEQGKHMAPILISTLHLLSPFSASKKPYENFAMITTTLSPNGRICRSCSHPLTLARRRRRRRLASGPRRQECKFVARLARDSRPIHCSLA